MMMYGQLTINRKKIDSENRNTTNNEFTSRELNLLREINMKKSSLYRRIML
ncbi:hypothetical protein [Peptostreptococcus faecalis]|uniref:hypothetical protein n=1 Tax=Peptostreptococcus faecalis TaxID=2045015 RepID=UPI0015E109F2|nr:hypothetical protein [Peptostreptococcus faecalis]